MYIIHARWFYDKFSVDLLDLRLKHTVLGILSSSARNFWRKKFLQEQIFVSWRLIVKIVKISTSRKFPAIRYFGHLSCIPFVCVTCKVQGMLTLFEQHVVEKLSSFVNLDHFQKAYKSAFLVRFVVASGEFLGCMLVVEMPGMYQIDCLIV